MIRLRRQEKYSVKLFDLIRKADTDKDAAFELGMLYLNGNNICQDTQRALFYFQQASELGHLGVEVIYAYLYKCGAPNFEPNLIKAAESFEFAGLYIQMKLYCGKLSIYGFMAKRGKLR